MIWSLKPTRRVLDLRAAVDRRVERWRGSLGQAQRFAGPFVCRCLILLALPRFHLPLIEPDVPN